MEIFAGLSVGVLILAALVVVTKTLALWFRTRGLPELLLSLYLSFATVIGYPLAITMGLIPASENWQIHVVAQVVMALGWVSLLLFTLNVFRRDTSWAKWLVGLSVSFVVATVGAYILEVTGANPRTPQEMPGFTAIISTPVAIAYFWTAFEALFYHRQLKLRLRLGLAENAVVNRVLLWGLMALAAGAALVINVAALLAGSYLSPPIVVISSIFGLVHASCLFLAFHPPAWYRRWLESSAPVAAA
jgi:hypothetical protein